MEELNLLIYVAHKFANCDDSRKDTEKTIRKLKNGAHPLLARRNISAYTETDGKMTVTSIPAATLQHATFVSPVHQLGFMYTEGTYLHGLNQCLTLLSKCNILLLCRNWQTSRGCIVEYAYAKARKIPIILEREEENIDAIM